MWNRFAEEIDFAEVAAREAGGVLVQHFQKDQHVVRKSLKELVSKADIDSEKLLMDQLGIAFPNDSIISEERKGVNASNERVWVLDPLDGSHNFIAGLPFWSVSIGLIVNNVLEMGVIYFPLEDEMFCAVNGEGAFCNNKRINVSNNVELSKAVVTYDNQFYLEQDSFKRYERIVNAAFTTRIFGSATRDICLTALGYIDGRIWNRTKLVDLAAGSVILRESGGCVTDFIGNDPGLDFRQVVASNGHIHKTILQEINIINNT